MPSRNDFTIVRAAMYDCPAKAFHRAGDPECPVCVAVKAADQALSRIAKRYQGLQRIPFPAAEYVKTPEPGSRARLVSALEAWEQLDESLKGAT